MFIGTNGVAGVGIFLLPGRLADEILAKRRTPVQSYRIELEGTRAEEHPRRYTHIKVRHIVSGEGITQMSMEKSVNLSHDKYCSAAASLNAEIEAEANLAS